MSVFADRAGVARDGDDAAADVPDFARALPRLLLEMDRARRFEHPLTAIVVSVDGATAGASSYHDLELLLAREMRAIDVLGGAPEAGCFGVLLAETDRRGAEACVRRLDALLRRGGAATLRAGIAEFPHDGMTVDVLFDCAATARQEVADLVSAAPRHRRASRG